jgi:phosphoglycolate phosphatase
MMKYKIDVIIFDFDGVIVDSGSDIANAVNYTLNAFGQSQLPREEIISYVGRGAKNLIRDCFKDADEETIGKALPIYLEYYMEHAIIDTVLYPNVKETLEYFRDKKLGVVTNKPEELTKRILEGLGVREYFEVVLGPESLTHMKPHPEGLLKVLEAFGTNAEDALMIGDSYTDIQAGKSAGTYTCGVTYGLGAVEVLSAESPDFLIGDMLQLTQRIE